MKPTKTDLRLVRCAERLAEWNASQQWEQGEDGCPCRAVVTREGLAGVLLVSVRTVDEMVAKGEITPMRPGGVLVRFYLPDVLRELTAAAVARLEKLKGGTDFTNSHEQAQKTQREQPQMNADGHGCGALNTRNTRKT